MTSHAMWCWCSCAIPPITSTGQCGPPVPSIPSHYTMGQAGWSHGIPCVPLHSHCPSSPTVPCRVSFRRGGGVPPPLGNFVPPLGDFNLPKLNSAHYMHPPQMSSDVFLPPLGLNEPLPGDRRDSPMESHVSHCTLPYPTVRPLLLYHGTSLRLGEIFDALYLSLPFSPPPP